MYDGLVDFIGPHLAVDYTILGSATVTSLCLLAGTTMSVLVDRTRGGRAAGSPDRFTKAETRRADRAETRLRKLDVAHRRILAERVIYREELVRLGKNPDDLVVGLALVLAEEPE